MYASGLPVTGSMWNFGNDSDLWAFCLPTMEVKIHQELPGDSVGKNLKEQYWEVTNNFSTKRSSTRCQDEDIEDPLLEPQRVSGSFIRSTIEATHDRNGNPILSVSKRMLRGKVLEFDDSRPTVIIGQNVASLGLSTFAAMVNRVNAYALWGLPARCIKLGNVGWERKIYGQCYYYYSREFEFEINSNTFDREVLDESSYCLRGKPSSDGKTWEAEAGLNKNNPSDFGEYIDKYGNPATTALLATGMPCMSEADFNNAHTVDVEYYYEADFLTLGIPVVW
jgi:hypothetical protein